jgi:hypothetical protein
MEKVVRLSNEEAEAINKLFGVTDFNTPPTNFEEVDEEWLATKSTFRIYGFKYTWFQQVRLPSEKHLFDIHCFGSYDGTGFAMHVDYWGKKIRYFKFAGCKHEFRTPTREEYAAHHDYPGNCYHISVCDKCGFWYTVDSSD